MELISRHQKTIEFEGQDIHLPLFLDHQSTTPLAPQVRSLMLEVMAFPGNAESDSHVFGFQAQAIIQNAKAEVAALINAYPDEIIFTSGATEANNLALHGPLSLRPNTETLLTTQIEHSSILTTAQALEKRGHKLCQLPVAQDGTLDVSKLQTAIASTEVALVSVQMANNEIGTLQNIFEIGALCQKANILFHCDAVQAATTQTIDVKRDQLSLLSLSSHKIYGPQGIGALFVKRGTPLSPVILGGGQQENRRAGTLPTALIAGFGEASRLARQCRDTDRKHLMHISNLFKKELRHQLGANIQFNGSETSHIPGCISATFTGIEAVDLLLEIPELALSTGSACASHAATPSHILTALGLDAKTAGSTVRIGLGRYVTETESRYSANLIAKTYLNLVT